jgi:fucose permease
MIEQPISPQLKAARLAVSILFFMNGMVLAGLTPFYPVIQDRLHLSASALGQSILFAPLGAILTIPFISPFLNKYGARRVVLICGTALCLDVPFAVAAPSVLVFRCALFLLGMCNSYMDVSMNAEAVAVQNRYPTSMLSSTHGWWSVGGFAAGGAVALTAHFSALPMAHSIVASFILFGLLLFGCAHTLPHEPVPDEGGPMLALPRGVLLLIGVLLMFGFGTEGACWDWTAIYLHKTLLAKESTAAIGFGLFCGAMAVGRLTGDRLINRIGLKKTLEIGAMAAAAGILMAVTLPSVPASIAGFMLCGYGLSNVVPILFRAAGNVPGVPPGTGIAAVSTCGYGMFFLAPPLIGFVADKSSLSVAIGSVGILILAVAIWGPSALRRTTIG